MALNNNQKLKYDIYSTLHECPWYKRMFHKYPKKFRIIRSNTSGIGENVEMKGSICGKTYDITDYDLW